LSEAISALPVEVDGLVGRKPRQAKPTGIGKRKLTGRGKRCAVMAGTWGTDPPPTAAYNDGIFDTYLVGKYIYHDIR
tara:strand:- start:146 stop:376 length:231 start_codon:yes stop_codon:yes gene_type:complete